MMGLAVFNAPAVGVPILVLSSLMALNVVRASSSSCERVSTLPDNPFNKFLGQAKSASVRPEMLNFASRNHKDSLWGEKQLICESSHCQNEDFCEIEGGVKEGDSVFFYKSTWLRQKINERILATIVNGRIETPTCELATLDNGKLMSRCQNLVFENGPIKVTNLPKSMRDMFLSIPPEEKRALMSGFHRADFHFPVENPEAENYESVLISMVSIFVLIPDTHFDDLLLTKDGVPAVIDCDGIAHKNSAFFSAKYSYNILKRVPAEKQDSIIEGVIKNINNVKMALPPLFDEFNGVSVAYLKENKDKFLPYFKNIVQNERQETVTKLEFDHAFNRVMRSVDALGSFSAF